MSQSGSLVPHPTPSTEFLESLLTGVAVIVDLVALAVLLPIPTALLFAPLVVRSDQIDLGVWLINTPTDAWLASIPGAVFTLVIAAGTMKASRLQRAWLKRRKMHVPIHLPLAGSHHRNGLSELTDRETQVLKLMSEGLTNGGIAERLFISDATVRKHVGRIFAKLDVDGKTRDRRVTAVLIHVRNSTTND